MHKLSFQPKTHFLGVALRLLYSIESISALNLNWKWPRICFRTKKKEIILYMFVLGGFLCVQKLWFLQNNDFYKICSAGGVFWRSIGWLWHPFGSMPVVLGARSAPFWHWKSCLSAPESIKNTCGATAHTPLERIPPHQGHGRNLAAGSLYIYIYIY